MPDEAKKAIARRSRDPNFTYHYFVGVGIDVGGGDDGLEKQANEWLMLDSCRTWDLADGDAQFLETVPADAYDFLHSSHCLEHMVNPLEALSHWIRVVKPGGYLVILVPDEDMYEQGVFPSTFNGDHKRTFTVCKAYSWSTKSVSVIELLGTLRALVDIIKVEQLHGSYDWKKRERVDQTAGSAECAIEIILRKRTPVELQYGGRFAAWMPAVAQPIVREAP